MDQWITQQHRTGGALTEKDCHHFDLPEDIRKISHGGAVYLEHLAFLENLRTHARPLTDANVAWWATAIPLAAESAITEQRLVELAEFGSAPPML